MSDNVSSFAHFSRNFNLTQFIRASLQEDVGDGDHTSLAVIPPTVQNSARLIIRENGMVAGVEVAKRIFSSVDKNLIVSVKKSDGSLVRKGDVILTVTGNARSILTAERLVLNCLQRMSGIATYTHKLIQLCKPYKVKITDTRKTTPGFRALEKIAVRIGGGHNHRFGLYDMILIKNNHIDFCGGIKKAVKRTNDYRERKKLNLKIEIEARDLSEVKEILSAGNIDRILLDNFSIRDIKKAIQMIKGKFETELSGRITEKNIKQYASLGANYISVGALTHRIQSLDMSLTAV